MAVNGNVGSRQLLIGASLLQAISLFMLSLAKPNQYYQVDIYYSLTDSTTNSCRRYFFLRASGRAALAVCFIFPAWLSFRSIFTNDARLWWHSLRQEHALALWWTPSCWTTPWMVALDSPMGSGLALDLSAVCCSSHVSSSGRDCRPQRGQQISLKPQINVLTIPHISLELRGAFAQVLIWG